MLVVWERLALALLVPGILADHAHHIVAAHDLACFTKTFNGGSDFHERESAWAVAVAKCQFDWVVMEDWGSRWMIVP